VTANKMLATLSAVTSVAVAPPAFAEVDLQCPRQPDSGRLAPAWYSRAHVQHVRRHVWKPTVAGLGQPQLFGVPRREAAQILDKKSA
jgi:hypothetical protein